MNDFIYSATAELHIYFPAASLFIRDVIGASTREVMIFFIVR